MGANTTSFLVGMGGGERGTFAFQVVFGVESGLFTFHLDIRLSIQVFFSSTSFGMGIQSKEFPSS
jgi:hypothetical protein